MCSKQDAGLGSSASSWVWIHNEPAFEQGTHNEVQQLDLQIQKLAAAQKLDASNKEVRQFLASLASASAFCGSGESKGRKRCMAEKDALVEKLLAELAFLKSRASDPIDNDKAKHKHTKKAQHKYKG